jgi:hypothetical protein
LSLALLGDKDKDKEIEQVIYDTESP